MEICFNSFLREELSINELQLAMDGEITSKQLVMYYLYRIVKYDQNGTKINSMLEINPEAIFIAEALDNERN
jgi:amidase